MLYMVLYSGWHQINKHEVCALHSYRHFVTVCTKNRNCSKSLLRKTDKNWFLTLQKKIALEKWALMGSQKNVQVSDYLLESVGIPETHPFCLA